MAADNTERFSRGMKVFYEKMFNSLMGGKKGVDETLFPSVDNDLNANFALDDLIFTPHSIAFRKAGEQAQVIPYTPGTGQVQEVPRASAKTPIDERLRDAVIAGGEAFESFATNNGRLMSQILKQHTTNWNVTKWKLALDTLRTSTYNAYGLGGEDIGLSVTQTRDASLSIAYNFRTSGNTMDKALKAAYDAGRALNLPASQLVCLMGKKWLKEFENDTAVQAKREANAANEVLQQQMDPTELDNTFGLQVVGRYRPAGCLSSMRIAGYEVDTGFYQYSGATEEEFLPDEEMVLFSLGSTRYTVNRGLDILNDSGGIVRVVGDIVYDEFTEKDPVGNFLRSSMRKLFMQADPNTVVRDRGTFDAGSE